ncbi:MULTISPECIES: LPS translocon maturation chaperone LptM [Photorhabdus]|uniref:LPS-assembly lipoprotein LptM n=2 Tax=Photorhabdus TaxID=29487 RepID=A0ABX0AZM3_9GAMM|nr:MULTISPECIES: lipoprotein [Photorhabdus]MCC8373289.1 lipoprotein [Photorhabdus bodei]MCC8463650.1 lipoprotein [Photorhabdus bodei]MCT8354223.1 lipoprotein [Photorhabdus kayaii]MDB6369171.1 lipoprotein [Photorhabdus bodei]MDB6373540.1 lipoprotein [Photorhabdus bodei]
MKKKLRGFLAIITLFVLSGCGLKGPLYFPPEQPSTEKATTASQISPNTGQQEQQGQKVDSTSQK